jgi:hypothetical protein
MQEDWNLNDDKHFEISVTIIDGASNIFTIVFIMVEKFINERCVSKLHAPERRDSFKISHASRIHDFRL